MVMHRVYVLELMTAAILLAACSAGYEPVRTVTPTLPVKTPAPSITPTKVIPSRTPIEPARTRVPSPTARRTPVSHLTPPPTPIVAPLFPPPPGLAYRVGNELWRIDEQGNPEFLLSVPEVDYAWPVGDDYVIYEGRDSRNVGISFYLIHLQSGRRIELIAPGSYHFCDVWSIDKPTLTLMGIVQTDAGDPGYDCKGTPALITLDGKVYPLVDPDGWSWGFPSQSPDGRIIAFNANGKPYLYEWGVGVKPFRTDEYHFPKLDNPRFYDQSWSPSGTKIAWTVYESSDRQGFGIFDLETKTSMFLTPYNVQPFEVSETYIDWSADENYIRVANGEYDLFAILSIDGSYVRRFDDFSIRWSPVDLWLAHVIVDDTHRSHQIRIETVEGNLIHQLPQTFESTIWVWFYWSTDGQLLYIVQQPAYTNHPDHYYVLAKTGWQFYRLDLPEGAELVSLP